MNKIKTTIIGLGRIGLRHAEILKSIPNFEIEAIVDIDSSKKEIAENQFKTKFYLDINEIPNNIIENAIAIICTPNGLHCQQSLIAINKNYNVLCEKPFGLKVEDCEQVIKQAATKNKTVFCVMQNRYSSPAKWLKSLIEEKQLGKIYQVVVNCFWNRNDDYYKNSDWKGTKKLDGGILFTQFSHFVDSVFWLFGDIKIIAAKQYAQKLNNIIEFEDAGYFAFETSNNEFGTFNYSINHFKNNLESSIVIIGEKGSLKIGGQYMEKVEFCNIENYQMPKLEEVNPPNNYGNYKGSASNHLLVYQNLFNYINNQPYNLTFANEGKKVVEIIESVINF